MLARSSDHRLRPVGLRPYLYRSACGGICVSISGSLDSSSHSAYNAIAVRGRSIRVGFLAGDVNQNRVVTLGDLGLVNAQVAQPVTAANYLKDVNASGTLTLADK